MRLVRSSEARAAAWWSEQQRQRAVCADLVVADALHGLVDDVQHLAQGVERLALGPWQHSSTDPTRQAAGQSSCQNLPNSTTFCTATCMQASEPGRPQS